MATLPEALPFLYCNELNIKFISPAFCEKRKTMKKVYMQNGVIVEDPSVVLCHECRKPITFVK